MLVRHASHSMQDTEPQPSTSAAADEALAGGSNENRAENNGLSPSKAPRIEKTLYVARSYFNDELFHHRHDASSTSKQSPSSLLPPLSVNTSSAPPRTADVAKAPAAVPKAAQPLLAQKEPLAWMLSQQVWKE